jgi:hypothetical protein
MERKNQELRDSSDLQRRQRLGADGRMREAVDIQTKNIMERNQQAGVAVPSYSEARAKAERNAEKVYRRVQGE